MSAKRGRGKESALEGRDPIAQLDALGKLLRKRSGGERLQEQGDAAATGSAKKKVYNWPSDILGPITNHSVALMIGMHFMRGFIWVPVEIIESATAEQALQKCRSGEEPVKEILLRQPLTQL